MDIKSDCGYLVNKPPQNFTFALEASLLGQMFIFWTISQPQTLSADIPAPGRGLFTKYSPMSIKLCAKLQKLTIYQLIVTDKVLFGAIFSTCVVYTKTMIHLHLGE